MANPGLLAAITEHRFEEWRRANPTALIDLSGADLRALTLSGVPLEGADLSRTILDNLIVASVEGANLRDVRTDRINGSGPFFHGISFRGSDLSNADFERASLFNCDLSDALLDRINFKEAIFHDCRFRGAHVSEEWESLPAVGIVQPTTLYQGHAQFPGAHFTGCDFRMSKLMGADFSRSQFLECDFAAAKLDRACLNSSRLWKSNFEDCSMKGAALAGAEASESNFRKAVLTNANLSYAEFGAQHVLKLEGLTVTPTGMTAKSASHLYFSADCSGANFTGSNLQFARLVRTNLDRARLVDCLVFGASVWGTSTQGAEQRNLRVSGLDEPSLTVDTLAMAQFIHLIRHERSLQSVLEQITSKVVLLLGRFTDGGRGRLAGLADALRARELCPVVFDWDPPASRDSEEVVRILAGLSAFVIVDLTDPRSTPAELMMIADHVKSVPIQPVVRAPQAPFSMLEAARRTRPYILEPVRFSDDNDLADRLAPGLIDHCLAERARLAR
jgi:uncharacterized protein YjbI with pentapeptide repeats